MHEQLPYSETRYVKNYPSWQQPVITDTLATLTLWHVSDHRIDSHIGLLVQSLKLRIHNHTQQKRRKQICHFSRAHLFWLGQ